MFRLARLIIYLLIIGGLILVFIRWNGGDKIRWIGKKAEEIGKTVKKKTEIIGKKADQLKEDIIKKEKSARELIEKMEALGIIKRNGKE